VTLQVDAYPGNFAGLGGFVARALRELAQPPAAGAHLSVLSPIPVSAGHGFRTGASVAKLVRRTGWRAVVMNGEKPVALVDLKDNRPLSVRGADASRAMVRVLQEADHASRAAGGRYKLRFVVFHSLFVTALWLSGRKSLFIPTRVGGKGRPRPHVYAELDFLRLLKRREQKMHRHVKGRRRMRL
jgi:hypothetical protein